MSTVQSTTEVRQLRREVLKVNSELRTFTHLAADGKIAARDFLVLSRLLTGGNERLDQLIVYLQTTIALLQTAQIAAKALNISLAATPWGAVALGIGIFASVVAGDQLMRRPR